jgi:maltose O-acetyltransferase
MDDASRSMRDRMLAGELFSFDGSLREDATRCRELLRRINDATPDQDAERDAWLRELLGAFGEDSNIRPPFRCELGFQTYVGDRVFANFGLVCLDTAPITIGDDSQLGPGVQLAHAEPSARGRPAPGALGDVPSRSRSAATSGSAALSSSAPASPSATTPWSARVPW